MQLTLKGLSVKRFAVAAALASAALPAPAYSEPEAGPAASPSSTHAAGGVGRVIFSRDAIPAVGEQDYDVFAINPDGSGLADLTPGLEGDQIGVSIDPTGTRIAFRNGGGGVPFDIWTKRLDGSPAAPLTADPEDDFLPSYSPDGRQLVFMRDLDPGMGADYDLMLIGADGSGLRNLTNTPGVNEIFPEFSPDGRRVVFNVRYVAALDDELGVIGVDGSGRAPLAVNTLLAGSQFNAAFSPDGKRLAFTSDPGERLYVSAADGSNPVNVTPTFPQGANNASWSPDGSLLVWDNDGGDLFLVPSAGGPVSRLTPEDTGDLAPVWEHIFLCAGRRATIVGDDGPDKIKGTKKADVIVANAGRDIVRGRGGNDRICGGRGKDQLRGNNGRDRIFGQAGADLLAGGRATDALRGGKGKDKELQ